MTNFDDEHLLVALESAASPRTIHKVKKNSLNTGFEEYTSGGGAFNGVIRSMQYMSDGSLIVSKSTAIEKIQFK